MNAIATPIATTTSDETLRTIDSLRFRGRVERLWTTLRKNRRGAWGLVILVVIMLAGVFAPWLTPYDPLQQSLGDALQPPSWAHWMGTDSFGRDMFTRILYGVRTSLLSGVLAVVGALLIGGALGAIAGYYGGRLDNVILRGMDVLLALPTLLLAIAIVSALGGGLVNMLLAIGLAQIPIYCRTVRAEVMRIREQEFIEVARSLGEKDGTIILRHVLPNCTAPIIIRVAMGMAATILACASLSFIGLGVAPPTPEWGSMLSGGREYLRTYPHLTIFPGLMIMITVLALNFIGDGLRDALDPRMKATSATRKRSLRRSKTPLYKAVAPGTPGSH
ncbi:ABC transporter permease [Agromyces silvae]|uniref:ABC transporter permease n=1 Tax=Agromyces silvae TaxID=3388266 RepID=UPI00280B6A00|nr:ABC transporter permease [Agromyces protaetiae]